MALTKAPDIAEAEPPLPPTSQPKGRWVTPAGGRQLPRWGPEMRACLHHRASLWEGTSGREAAKPRKKHGHSQEQTTAPQLPARGPGDTVRLGSTSSPLCRTPGGEEGHRGHSHICHPRTARGGGPQTRLHVRVTWRTWSKCRCPGHTPGQIIRTSVGWGTGVSSFKIISKLAFLRPGGNRKTSFPGEHKEVSGKQA